MTPPALITEAQIDAAVEAQCRRQWAPHELPLDPDLLATVRETARLMLEAAAREPALRLTPPAAAGWDAEKEADHFLRKHADLVRFSHTDHLNRYTDEMRAFARKCFTAGRSAARSAEAMRWQLIETATKDETRRLLWAPSMPAPHIGYWDRGWRNNHYGEREVFWYFAEVTHWMPLPAAPAILPPAQPPAVALSSIPAAEIEAVRPATDGLHCVYGRCQGIPNSDRPCNPGCYFQMSAVSDLELLARRQPPTPAGEAE